MENIVSESAGVVPDQGLDSSPTFFDCKLNALEPAELIRKYEQAGFIYPAKLQRLKPLLPEIVANWSKAMQGGQPVLCCLTYEDPTGGDWSTVSAWRTTSGCWNVQHLASIGSPVASRAVNLGMREFFLREGRVKSNQVWFRPANKYPNRIFGSVMESFGQEQASVAAYQYIGLPLNACRNGTEPPTVREAKAADMPAIRNLAEQTRGKLYAAAEELAGEDFRLSGVDDLYRKVGLSRYRRVWIAERRGASAPSAAAIVYRGPLGLNFSFLENRCDLIVAPEVSDAQLPELMTGLLAALGPNYADFTPGFVPVTADNRVAAVLLAMGGQLVAQYAQSIWLQEGIADWPRHLDRFYARIMRAERHFGLGARKRLQSSTQTPASV